VGVERGVEHGFGHRQSTDDHDQHSRECVVVLDAPRTAADDAQRRSPTRAAARHLSHRAGWLRAAVLGANDGIVSTASLVLGVAASGASTSAVMTAGIAGLAA